MSCNKQCVICEDASYPLLSVTSKGLSSLIVFSAQREDYDLNNYFSRKQVESDRVTGVYVHEKCRRDYNNRKRISSWKPDPELMKLKIETRKFTENSDWLLHCFLCGKTCAQDPKHPKRNYCHYASTFKIRNTILRNYRQRTEEHWDEWALQVKRRVYICINFVAAEARYHAACHTRFSARKLAQETEARKTERKKNEEMIMLFEETCMWLENNISIHSVQEFSRKMTEICKEVDKDKVYDARYIKKLLKNW